MRQRIGERYYGTPHTTSGYPLNRKSVSCPRAYRAFLVTLVIFSDMDNQRVRILVIKGSRADTLLEMPNV